MDASPVRLTGLAHVGGGSKLDPAILRALLADPQTSGGLLVACARDSADAILARIRAAGHPAAAIVGRAEAGAAAIRVAA